VGKRTEFMAGTFEFQDKLVQIVEKNGRQVIATRPNAEQDELENAPVF
jgi:hypothetical protein